MNKMSFKQFYSVQSIPQKIVGGYTTPRAVGPHDLDVWNKVLEMHDIGAELAAKGAPTSVKSQIVSGVNYIFTFADGSTVTVYHQSLTNTLRVTKTTPTIA